jgi:FlaA1/EpsC-like NDP-sugar epimerase
MEWAFWSRKPSPKTLGTPPPGRYNSVMTHQPKAPGFDVSDTAVVGGARRRRFLILTGDLLVVLAAHVVSFLIRFDFSVDDFYMLRCAETAPYVLVAFLICAYYFGLNRGLRYYASFGDVVNIGKACGSAGIIVAAVIVFLSPGKFPRSVLLLTPILSALGVAVVHALVRYSKDFFHVRTATNRPVRTAVIVGAGDVGELVFRTLRSDEVNYRVVAFFDHDSSKWGMRLHGVPVVGGLSTLGVLLGRRPIDEVIVAVSTARGAVVAAVAEILRGLDKRPTIRVAPSMAEMLRSPASGANPRKVQPADLLNRKEVRLDAARIARSIEGKTVLVTGAGGTIGGELSRQLVAYAPKKILLLENHATALFYREAEVRERAPGVEVIGVLGDVRDQVLLDRIFRQHKPQVVYHAAAHKHVFQLETNIQEGVSNNVVGTYNLASQADKHGVEVFMLISTDKAVRPSCVMGATKRAAEIAVTDFAKRSKTRFAAVRFGNVLGSSGSVLKIFQEQIEQGRAVTITHPDVTRFFMTVEEAVGLVLQAGSMARGGEVFMLKMGEPVRILDMARNLILLSGLEPDRDVEIRVTGLKTGEKLNEELVEDPAGEEQSEHPDIMVLRRENMPVEDLPKKILELELAARSQDKDAAMRKLLETVPTFTADPVHGAADAAEPADI